MMPVNVRTLTRPYRLSLLAVCGLILIVNGLTLVFPWAVKVIVDDVLQGNQTEVLNRIAAILAVAIVLRAGANYLRRILNADVAEAVVRNLRERIYAHIHTFSLKQFKTHSTAALMGRMTTDLEILRRFFNNDFVESLASASAIVFIFVALCVMDLPLTVWSLAALPFLIAIYIRMLPRLKAGYRDLRQANESLTGRIGEGLNGFATVKAFDADGFEMNLLRAGHDRYTATATRIHRLNTGLQVAMEFFSGLSVFFILWLGTRRVLEGQMTAGELIAFYSYLGLLFAPVIRLAALLGTWQEAGLTCRRVNDLLATPSALTAAHEALSVSGLKGLIELRNVSFAYGSEWVLKDVSLTIEPGEMIAIVGMSGAGKTTLAHLLLRFFDPQEGEILIDGRPLRKLNPAQYRSRIGVVLQDEYLFNDTILNNIFYGREPNRHKALEAVIASRLNPFVAELPDGFNTPSGEGGRMFSCGQRQRLAIARALAREPDVLILDEATSSLDALTENAIQESIARRMFGKTVILIAHRFSSLAGADRIVVLDHGRIAQSGTHAALMKEEGLYRELYREQFRERHEK